MGCNGDQGPECQAADFITPTTNLYHTAINRVIHIQPTRMLCPSHCACFHKHNLQQNRLCSIESKLVKLQFIPVKIRVRVGSLKSSRQHWFLHIYTHLFVFFLIFPKLNRQRKKKERKTPVLRWLVMWSYPYSYPDPPIPSEFQLCNLYIHHRPVLMPTLPVLMPTLVLQTSKLNNDMYVWIHWNSIETWL